MGIAHLLYAAHPSSPPPCGLQTNTMRIEVLEETSAPPHAQPGLSKGRAQAGESEGEKEGEAGSIAKLSKDIRMLFEQIKVAPRCGWWIRWIGP